MKADGKTKMLHKPLIVYTRMAGLNPLCVMPVIASYLRDRCKVYKYFVNTIQYFHANVYSRLWRLEQALEILEQGGESGELDVLDLAKRSVELEPKFIKKIILILLFLYRVKKL